MAILSVHYHELALKRGNRGVFERALRENVRRALDPLGRSTVRSAAGRLLVETEAEAGHAQDRLCRVSGVAYVLRARRVERDLGAAARAILDEWERAGTRPASFRISTRRADKGFPKTSVDCDREIGAIIHETTGVPVRLKGADEEVIVGILPREIVVGFAKRRGPGGLPAGTGGRVAVLMSGGIDSPVAAWRMINRGCRADLVHFHSHPLVDRTTQEKAHDLAAILNEWQFTTRLHLAPLAPIQTRIRLECPEALRVVLYRRFMLRIAERIARRRRCGALVTGESLGQVASQTLENLAAVDAVAALPVLRPLVGMDKQEIVATAERLGTYPVSIRRDQDCCQLFVPRHPATRTTRAQVDEAEEPLDVEALVREAVAGTRTVRIG